MRNKRTFLAIGLLSAGAVLVFMAWRSVSSNSLIPGWTPVNGALSHTLANLQQSDEFAAQTTAHLSADPTRTGTLEGPSTSGTTNDQASPSPKSEQSSPPPMQDDRQNLNLMTLEQLDALPGIGPSKAQAIIDYRNQHGPFKSVDELLNVKGIGDKMLDKLAAELFAQ